MPSVKKLVPRTLQPKVRRLKHHSVDLVSWGRKGFSSPSPNGVKWDVLRRYAKAPDFFIETGTNIGHTTTFLAQEICGKVITIEPEPKLAALARESLASYDGITLLEGTSEEKFTTALDMVHGTVAFWLDGHYSGGNTFLGSVETAIASELLSIEGVLDRLSVQVFVDDFRCFPAVATDGVGYPTRLELVDWATRNNLWWTVEHDIFVALSSSPNLQR